MFLSHQQTAAFGFTFSKADPSDGTKGQKVPGVLEYAFLEMLWTLDQQFQHICTYSTCTGPGDNSRKNRGSQETGH